MDKISLTNNLQNNITILSNDFIDNYMHKADGEYVKIYLLILRLSGSNLPIRVDELADTLELTRQYILRALNYWEKVGLLKLNDHSSEKASTLTDSPKTVTMANMKLSNFFMIFIFLSLIVIDFMILLQENVTSKFSYM